MSKSVMVDVVKALLYASEKGAVIARSCCGHNSDFDALLVAEKGEGEANPRFEKDFKTIADVVAQVCAKHEIEKYCPGLANNVRGEECNEIQGVTIELKETEEETAELLCTLIPIKAATCMAKAAHHEIGLEFELNLDEIVPSDFLNIDLSDLGVWIDPIDATAEFIAGVNGGTGADEALSCVTVLIGAYLKSTGAPIFGVINQPFFNGNSPRGRIVWGLCHGNIHKWGVSRDEKEYPKSNVLLISSAENTDVVSRVMEVGLEVQSLPGAGNKLMKVALGQAAGYLLTKGTTFRWDTCAPHAIIKARGGDILDYNTLLSLTYNDPDEQDTQGYCNSGGLIAFVDITVFENLRAIREN